MSHGCLTCVFCHYSWGELSIKAIISTPTLEWLTGPEQLLAHRQFQPEKDSQFDKTSAYFVHTRHEDTNPAAAFDLLGGHSSLCEPCGQPLFS